jgi:hypothetical protein
MFRTVPLSIITSLFTVHSATVYFIQDCRQLSSRSICSCSKAVYKPVWHITSLSVQWINSWWWTDELSKSRRISWQNKFVKLVHLVGFVTKKLTFSVDAIVTVVLSSELLPLSERSVSKGYDHRDSVCSFCPTLKLGPYIYPIVSLWFPCDNTLGLRGWKLQETGENCIMRNFMFCILHLKCNGTRAEPRFRLSAKWTSPFKSAGASVQSTTGSRGVRISDSNAGYTTFRGSVKSTGYPLHSPVSPSLPLPCVTVCHHISAGLYSGDQIKEDQIG